MPPYYNKFKQFLKWLETIETPLNLPLMGNSFFSMVVVKYNNKIIGVEVDNLGATNAFLPIELFRMTIEYLSNCQDNYAPKGNAHNTQLGNPGMELSTIEGLIAHYYYNTPIGNWALSRITPISHILDNARDENNLQIIVNANGALHLLII